MEDSFKIVIPADLEKSKDGEWRISGLASSSNVDRQGEVIMPSGVDCTPIDSGKGFFNFDHDNSPENTIGLLERYKKSEKGLFVQGKLFKNHSRAKAVYEIMSSLNKNEKGRVGLSVEGKVIERDSFNPKIIKRCIIKNCAVTFNPVNEDTYVDLVKSLSGSEIQFESTGKVESTTTTTTSVESEPLTFTASQVVSILEKALGISGSASYGNTPPAQLSGGSALQQEESEKKKKLKKMSRELYKSNMITILEKLQVLYPQNSRFELWEAVKDRMETRYPQIFDINDPKP